MTLFLETMIDKFIFRVADDRSYLRDGLWLKSEGSRVRIGLSDFWQGRNGDITFVELPAPGDALVAGEILGTVETIKVNIELVCPVSGTIVEANPAMREMPEWVNQDPYGEGWLVMVEAPNWETDVPGLISPQAYLSLIQKQAEEDMQ